MVIWVDFLCGLSLLVDQWMQIFVNMTEEQEKGSRILAEFISCSPKKEIINDLHNISKECWPLPSSPVLHCNWEPEYHISLDWLWYVWIKFRNIFNVQDIHYAEFISYKVETQSSFIFRDIDAIFKSLVNAINWYNKIK